MVFTVEKLSSPAVRSEFETFGFKQPGTNAPAEASQWIVDREKGVFIASLGGGMFDRPNFFQLATRNGIRASVEARVEAKGAAVPQGLEVRWNVSAILVPKEHAASAAEIREWVVEALKQFGYLGESELSKEVHVGFSAARAAGSRS